MQPRCPTRSTGLPARKAAIVVAALLVALVSQAPAGRGAFPQSSARVEVLARANVVRIEGATPEGNAGVSVAGAGDVNGDGRAGRDRRRALCRQRGRTRAGSAYVCSAGPRANRRPRRARAGRLPDRRRRGRRSRRLVGRRRGRRERRRTGGRHSRRTAGRQQRPRAARARPTSSSAGRRRRTVDLAALGPAGFRIDGAAAGDEAGDRVAGAGDVNGDGRADVHRRRALRRQQRPQFSGSAYVVFGQAAPGPSISPRSDRRGFRIDGAAEADLAGWSVSGAGDVNGDGQTDVLVGARYRRQQRPRRLGLRVRRLRREARRRPSTSPRSGKAASGSTARRQVISPAWLGRTRGRPERGRAGGCARRRARRRQQRPNRVGLGLRRLRQGGRPTNVDLAALGQAGFRIDGAAARRPGRPTRSRVAGDVNGDGHADVLVGAHYADNNGRKDSGSAYVVFGKDSADDTCDLAALGRAGFRIDGAATGDGAGWAVAGAGDLNGDGRADVVHRSARRRQQRPRGLGLGLRRLRQGRVSEPSISTRKRLSSRSGPARPSGRSGITASWSELPATRPAASARRAGSESSDNGRTSPESGGRRATSATRPADAQTGALPSGTKRLARLLARGGPSAPESSCVPATGPGTRAAPRARPPFAGDRYGCARALASCSGSISGTSTPAIRYASAWSSVSRSRSACASASSRGARA